ncbi:CDP-alcohol phosphatidyltransferase family protein [Blattabacterium cuenoti]|uniref:CDP-alcohol phosphatidyltransferase family protein n=1 Tax=Blattabacterium cuenoti TaxID=1653831 RepID=UPI00163C247B|nr:CDP-alcohol phosphatidyltransferase family protein [Blattabacterium cuenoti]
MKKIRNAIPNIFTLLNLLFGCISITFLQSKCFEHSAICTIFSLTFDFLDGFLSRFMKNESKLGKELDSLADMISFGLVPSIIVFILLKNIEGSQKVPFIEWSAFLIAIFSAWRLAEFNIDNSSKKNFGLTTPVNALFFTSLSILKSRNTDFFVLSPIKILFTIFFSCYFLISKIKMISFVFKGFSWKKNKIRYLFLLISIFLLLILHLIALPCIIIFYIITSIYFHRFRKNSH